MKLTLSDFLKLRSELPVIDVRSQAEFAAGHIPGALNVPLLNDDERVIVGTTYKNNGQKAAIMEGFRLVGPRLPDIISRTEEISSGNEVIVYCWRGGMRSSNFSNFIGMAGIRSHTLEGGYKTYRRAAIEAFGTPIKLVALTGYTGSGKSEVLRELVKLGEQIIDLEDLAHHKGSAFGGLLQPPQPTTEQFQNNLFERILCCDPAKRVWVEDESIAVGKIFLPVEFWNQLVRSPLVQMVVDKAVRIQRLVMEYGPADKEEFLRIMEKLTRKLGGQNFQHARERLLAGDMATVIDVLLTYYDKAYKVSIERRKTQLRHSISWDGGNMKALARTIIQQAEEVSV